MKLKTRHLAAAAGLLVITAFGPSAQGSPVGTAFTYQGVVADAGVPVDGVLDMRFSLWDSAVEGMQIGATLDQPATAESGPFSAELDFGAAPFADDTALWLQVEVSDDGGANYTTLDRQRVTPAPHSLSTRGINVTDTGNVGIGTVDPAYRLTIDQPGYGFSHVWPAGGTDVTTFLTGDGGWIGTRNNKRLFLFTNDSAPRVTLDTLGNLGVGTQSPTSRLDVRDFTLDGTGISAQQTGSGATIGVEGVVSGGAGVKGEATSNSATNYGVLGMTASPSGWGVFSQGRIGATGTKSFVIDHPLDPANKMLLHYSSEAPEPLNTYSGTVILDGAGRAIVALPGYVESINTDFRYQLTAIGGAAPNLHVATEIKNNRFAIAGGQPGLKVSWEVTARRNDAFVRLNGAPRELLKAPEHRGMYLLPEAYDAPPSMGIHTRSTETDR